jgi:hypothetical protein
MASIEPLKALPTATLAFIRKLHIGAELASRVKPVLLENNVSERDRNNPCEMPGAIHRPPSASSRAMTTIKSCRFARETLPPMPGMDRDGRRALENPQRRRSRISQNTRAATTAKTITAIA